MTDVQIINPTRNCNTTLQSSTLQSSNTTLNKNYSFQSLRTVKGNAVLDNYNGNSSIDCPLTNEYDGSPICLYPGDIITSISVYNGNVSFLYPNTYSWSLYGNKYPIPFLRFGDLSLAITPEPQYNYISQTWISNMSNVTNLFSNLNLFNLSVHGGFNNTIYTPVSYNTRPLYNSTIGSINNNSTSSYSGNCRWLTCMFRGMSTPIIPEINIF